MRNLVNNKHHIHQALIHRMHIFMELYQDFELNIYLLPEILIKTIRNTYQFTTHTHAYLSSIDIMNVLNISCTPEELDLLKNMENSLRKAKDYQECCIQINPHILLSLAQKLQSKILDLIE